MFCVFIRCRSKYSTVVPHSYRERTVKSAGQIISVLGGISLPWQFSAKHEDQESQVLGRLKTSFPEVLTLQESVRTTTEVPRTPVTHWMGVLLLFLFWKEEQTKGWISSFWVKHISQCQLKPIIFTANTQCHSRGKLQVNAAHKLSFWFH